MVGNKVFHKMYGSGKILMNSLDDRKCLVSFNDGGILWVYKCELSEITLMSRIKHYVLEKVRV